jgi:8-oxo-dGTP pyrophosphatase MutT (NUDIX family)
MKEMVVVYAVPSGIYPSQDAPILAVLKDRPANQKGRFNLPGGKIESGETPEQCAVRELAEETGLPGEKPVVMGKVLGSWGLVHCVRVNVPDHEIHPRPEETEECFWVPWDDLKVDSRLLTNLRVILPLMMTGVTGWVVSDEGFDKRDSGHMIGVTLFTPEADPE